MEKWIRKITESWIPVEDEMKHLCFGREWLLYVVTVCLAAGFTIAGFYAARRCWRYQKVTIAEIGDDSNCWPVFYQSYSRDWLAIV